MSYAVVDMTAKYSPVEAWFYDRAIAPVVEEWASRFLFDPAFVRSGKVLDVGGGGGQIALALARVHSSIEVTGLDLSKEQVARASERARRAGMEDWVSFVEGSALEMPFADNQFAAVYSICSIKHWSDPGRGIRECLRVLRPGGKLFVLEADRGCHFEDVQTFVAKLRLPAPLRAFMLPMFRTFVAGRSLSIEDMRALTDAGDAGHVDVAGLSQTPTWLAKITKVERA